MAFDLTKPSMTDANWATALGNVRENFRAIVQGDDNVFTNTTDLFVRVRSTGTTTQAFFSAYAGNGTTSSRKAYFESFSNETAPQDWIAGMNGTKNYVIRDVTAGGDRIVIDTSGNVGIGATPAFRLDVQGAGLLSIQCKSSNNSAGFLIDRFSNAFAASINFRTAGTDNHIFGTDIDASASNTLMVTNGAGVRRFAIDTNSNVVIGSGALATGATNGFLYISSSAGAPTGVPTAFTGRVTLHYDSTNNQIYVYNGAWKKTVALT